MRRSSPDQAARCVPVQLLVSIAREAPLASITSSCTTFESTMVLTFTTSDSDVGVMHTVGAANWAAPYSPPGCVACQQPSHAAQRAPPRDCAEADVPRRATAARATTAARLIDPDMMEFLIDDALHAEGEADRRAD